MKSFGFVAVTEEGNLGARAEWNDTLGVFQVTGDDGSDWGHYPWLEAARNLDEYRWASTGQKEE